MRRFKAAVLCLLSFVLPVFAPAASSDYSSWRKSDGTPQAVMLSYYDGPDTRGFAWQTSTSVSSGALWLLKGEWNSSTGNFDTNQVATATSTKQSTECYTHKAHVTGLAVGTWSYRLGTASHYAYGKFVVRDGKQPFVAVNITDIQLKSADKLSNWKNVVKAANTVLGGGSNADTIISCGDFFDQTNPSGYSRYVCMGVTADQARDEFADVAWTMVSGNHDTSYYKACCAENYDAAASSGGGCHSYDYGAAHVATIPYASSLSSGIEAWLKADLAAAQDAQWRILVMHFGPYTTADHGQSANATYVQKISGLCATYKVDLVLQGHDHTYSKTLPYLWSGPGYTSSATDSTAVNLKPATIDINGQTYYDNPEGTVYVSAGCAGDRVGENASIASSTYANRTPKIVCDRINVTSSYAKQGDNGSLSVNAPMFAVLTADDSTLKFDWYVAASATPTLFDTLRISKAPPEPPHDEDEAITVAFGAAATVTTITNQTTWSYAVTAGVDLIAVSCVTNDDNTATFTFTGVEQGTATVVIYQEDGVTPLKTVTVTVLPPDPMTTPIKTDFGGYTVTTVGATVDATTAPGELILIYTNTAAPGSLTLPADAVARVLVAGGGGSGGTGDTDSSTANKQKGNGGSGGKVEERTDLVLPAATYTMTVGAGGAACTPDTTKEAGKDGSGSSIAASGFTTISAAGGAGAVQNKDSSPTDGSGDNKTSDITGKSATYSVAGKQAASASADGIAGADGTGNGGSGCGNKSNYRSGAGGSGIVVVRLTFPEPPVDRDETIDLFVEESKSVTTIASQTNWAYHVTGNAGCVGIAVVTNADDTATFTFTGLAVGEAEVAILCEDGETVLKTVTIAVAERPPVDPSGSDDPVSITVQAGTVTNFLTATCSDAWGVSVSDERYVSATVETNVAGQARVTLTALYADSDTYTVELYANAAKSGTPVKTVSVKIDPVRVPVSLQAGGAAFTTNCTFFESRTWAAEAVPGTAVTASLGTATSTKTASAPLTITPTAAGTETVTVSRKASSGSSTTAMYVFDVTVAPPAPVETEFEGQVIRTFGATVDTTTAPGELILVYDNPACVGTLELPTNAVADILVVGGGGSGVPGGGSSGKHYGMSGTGGGGSLTPNGVLPAGSYTIAIGAGGASTSSSTGNAGGDSSISQTTGSGFTAITGKGAAAVSGTGSATAGTDGCRITTDIAGTSKTYGSGGVKAVQRQYAGSAGVNPGDGGQGGYNGTGNAGGAGADGIVVVRISGFGEVTPGPDVPAKFCVTPYLQRPATDAMSILFFTDRECDATVECQLHDAAGTPRLQKTTHGVWAAALTNNLNAAAKDVDTYHNSLYRHSVRFEGLELNRIYDYTVTLPGGATYSNTLRTAPDRNTPIRFVSYADPETMPPGHASYTTTCRDNFTQNLKTMKGRNPDLIACSGDLAGRGGIQSHWDEFWKQNAGGTDAGYGDILGSIPFLNAIGNHDLFDNGVSGHSESYWYYDMQGEPSTDRYLSYFEVESNGVDFANAPAPHTETRDMSQLFHRKDFGPVTLIFLDTNNGRDGDTDDDHDHDTNYKKDDGDTQHVIGGLDRRKGCRHPDFNVGTPQYIWLTNNLADAQMKSRFTFVFNHHCPYSRGAHNKSWTTGEDGSALALRFLTETFVRYGVDGWYCGHDEMLEHSITNGWEVLPDGSRRKHTLSIYDLGCSGDTVRKSEAVSNPLEYYYNSSNYDGTGHYGFLETDVTTNRNGKWTCTITPRSGATGAAMSARVVYVEDPERGESENDLVFAQVSNAANPIDGATVASDLPDWWNEWTKPPEGAGTWTEPGDDDTTLERTVSGADNTWGASVWSAGEDAGRAWKSGKNAILTVSGTATLDVGSMAVTCGTLTVKGEGSLTLANFQNLTATAIDIGGLSGTITYEFVSSSENKSLPNGLDTTIRDTTDQKVRYAFRGTTEANGWNLGSWDKTAFSTHIIVDAGTHAWSQNNNGVSGNVFGKNGTDENPTLLVKSGATLNFTGKDLSGYQNGFQDGGVIRVNAGGTLNFKQPSGSNPNMNYRQRLVLDPGSLTTFAYGTDKFVLHGAGSTPGTVAESAANVYVPASDGTAGPAILRCTSSNGAGLCINNTSNSRGGGCAIWVGANSRLLLDSKVSKGEENDSTGNKRILAKLGPGELEITGEVTTSVDFDARAGIVTLPASSGAFNGPFTATAAVTYRFPSGWANGAAYTLGSGTVTGAAPAANAATVYVGEEKLTDVTLAYSGKTVSYSKPREPQPIVSATAADATYNGQVQTPVVVVKAKDGSIVPANAYTVGEWSPSEPKKPGTYTATVTGTTESYYGDVQVSFTILSGPKPTFSVTPYLQRPAPTEMTVRFFTSQPCEATVTCGGRTFDASCEEATELVKVASDDQTIWGTQYRHDVRLTGLSPNTAYEYEVALDEGETYRNTLHTAPADIDTPVRFVAYSDSETVPPDYVDITPKKYNHATDDGRTQQWDRKDIGDDQTYHVSRSVGFASNLLHMASWKPDFYVIAGDIAARGGVQLFWDEYWKEMAGGLGKGYGDPAGAAPVLAVMGNHDHYDNRGVAALNYNESCGKSEKAFLTAA